MRADFSHPAMRIAACSATALLLLAGLASAELKIKGRYLYDPCGQKVVLRGVMDFIYSGNGPELDEIAKCGANHIWWWCTNASSISASQLDGFLGHAKQLKMIVMIDPLINGGSPSNPQPIIDWWASSKIKPVIDKYKDWLLAANMGEDDMPANQWVTANTQFVQGFRRAGIHVPNIITSGGMSGRDLKMILQSGASIVKADPDSNTGFIMEFYWDSYYEQPSVQMSLENGMAAIRDAAFYIIAHTSGYAYEPSGPQPCRWKVVAQLAQQYSIGSNYWAWQDIGTPQLSMTTNNTYNGLTGWGKEAAVTDQYSIQNTSVKTAFYLNGSCSGVAARNIARTPPAAVPLMVPGDAYDLRGVKVRTVKNGAAVDGVFIVKNREVATRLVRETDRR